MSEPSDLLDLVRQWVEKAEHDLINAEYMLTLGDGCPFDTVCFHAQQCVEKHLKALLTLRRIPFPKTHDLAELLALAPSDICLDLPLDEVTDLTPYAVETRYPGLWEPLTVEEARGAVLAARKFQAAVRQYLAV